MDAGRDRSERSEHLVMPSRTWKLSERGQRDLLLDFLRSLFIRMSGYRRADRSDVRFHGRGILWLLRSVHGVRVDIYQ